MVPLVGQRLFVSGLGVKGGSLASLEVMPGVTGIRREELGSFGVRRPMNDRVQRLVQSTRQLVEYIEKEFVFDKMGDAGCGGVDPYRSEKFDALIHDVREALKAMDPS